jgi:hypothetical protein
LKLGLRIRLTGLLLAAALGVSAHAAAQLIDVRTEVAAPDSVTVGERFRVTHIFSYPDSLTMSVPEEIDPGSCRLLSKEWSEDKEEGRVEKTLSLEAITIDLEQATLPALAVQFFTPAGDTLVAFTDEVIIPVRQLATEGADVRGLKQQWEAPRRYWPWIVAAAALVAAAILLWWWLRRRSRRTGEEPSVPVLPADYVALTELTRIERMDLVRRGEFKKYYTLVTDALRRYLSARFEVEAMDRTTDELLLELEDTGRRVDKLDSLLREADLVKFAKYVPGEEAGTAAMSSAREIVVKSTPRHDPATAAVGEAGEENR